MVRGGKKNANTSSPRHEEEEEEELAGTENIMLEETSPLAVNTADEGALLAKGEKSLPKAPPSPRLEATLPAADKPTNNGDGGGEMLV